MKLTATISLAAAAVCAIALMGTRDVQAQTGSAAERMASIRSQQMARNAMLARQRAAQNSGAAQTGVAVPNAAGQNGMAQVTAAQGTAIQQAFAQRAAMQKSAAQRAAASQRARSGSGAATMSQPSVAGISGRGSGSAGVRSTASGASLVGMRTALSSFAADMGRMPTAAEGLGVLLNRPPGAKNWRGPYISSVNWHQSLTDPWGNPYRYNVTGSGRYQMYTISSDGPDRRMGTSDDLRVQF